MKTIDAIFQAAEKLGPEQFLKLCKKLDKLEKRIWEAESKRVTTEIKKRKITDETIDQLVTRRRRESGR